MFIPAALGIAGTAAPIIGIGSALLSATGTLASGAASEEVARYNARVNEIQASTAETQAATKYAELRNRSRQRVAQAAVAAAESGFQLSGSFKDLLEQTAQYGELDALSAIYEGNVRATGYRNSARAELAKGKQAKIASYIGAGTKLLSGVASAYQFPGGTISPWQTSIVPTSSI